MPMFVSATDRHPVTVDGVNTIFVRPKMPFGIRQKVLSAVAKLSTTGDTGAGEADASFDIGAYQTALMINNIVGWEGPEFEDAATGKIIPCTPANILRLDADEPLVEQVLEEIERRSNLKGSPDPNSPTPTGSTSGGEPS